MRPEAATWKRLLGIGLPAGVEFGLIAVYMGVVYVLSQPFGAAAQAGFGIGQRVGQAAFMPVVALGFAVAPVAGQNFGARRGDRVRATFRTAAQLALSGMAVLVLVFQLFPATLIRFFSTDPAVVVRLRSGKKSNCAYWDEAAPPPHPPMLSSTWSGNEAAPGLELVLET